MIKQFEIGNYARKQVNEYLEAKACTLREAMDDETMSGEVAALLHEGFPAMVKKIYSLPKFQTFFWEKRELLYSYIQGRLEVSEKAKK